MVWALPMDEVSELKLAAMAGIRCYQMFISSQDMSVCNFTPTCSRFGMTAIGRYGLIPGGLMTADRLLRCNGLNNYLYPRHPETGKAIDTPEAEWPFSDRLAKSNPALPSGRAQGQSRGEEGISLCSAPSRGPLISDSEYVDTMDWARYYAPSAVRRFAEYLCQHQEFARAAGEYERLLILSAGVPGQDTFCLLAGRCYSKARQHEQADRCLRQAFSLNSGPEWRAQVLSELALNWLKAKRPELALAALLVDSATGVRTEASRTRLTMLRALAKAQSRDWRAVFELARDSLPKTDKFQQIIAGIASKGLHSPKRSPALAAGLSAVVPGLGKAYAGRVPDAVFSFVAIGLTGWQAYEGFRRDGTGSVRGWLYGSVGLTLYAGNVWGSAVAAWQDNRTQETLLQDRITALLEEIGD
ncbi:MAG: membrane protein insertion efficiency factor YidD [candidate division WOR-3 bacterium]